MADLSDLPDLTRATPISSIPEDTALAGRIGDSRVVVCRDGDALFAYSALCPHLGAPLDQGLIRDGVLFCPWHHARFDIRTGAAICAPAFDDLARYVVDQSGDHFTVRAAPEKPASAKQHASSSDLNSAEGPMVIVGGGAAGFAAADALRRKGWRGEIQVFSQETESPYDRTLLTKDYLEGAFGDDRLPIAQHNLAALDVRFETVSVEGIDIDRKTIRLGDGRTQRYAKLLLATGAAARALDVPGADSPHVMSLRSLADCRRIIASASTARRVAIIGGSFIALETAAAMRSRGIEVEVIAPEARPMEKILGSDLSDLIMGVHRQKGVALRLGAKVERIEAGCVVLEEGSRVAADLVIVGVGVTPRTELAQAAGLAIDRGVTVDSRLRTSDPDIYAAGDIARWPDALTGERIRVEHWAVAERQGQLAAANMLGADQACEIAPFFWTKHFDLAIRYVGHAESWDETIIEGDLAARDAVVRYRKGGRILAAATLGRIVSPC